MDLAGRWITTDSGQHILIKDGGGSVREQVRKHFAERGEPGHPDIRKPITEHPRGVNPMTLRERAAMTRTSQIKAGQRGYRGELSRIAMTRKPPTDFHAPNPVDKKLLELSRVGQGAKPARTSTNLWRRRELGRQRTARLATLGARA